MAIVTVTYHKTLLGFYVRDSGTIPSTFRWNLQAPSTGQKNGCFLWLTSRYQDMRLTSSFIYSWVWDSRWSCVVSFTLRPLYAALHGAARRLGGPQRRARFTRIQKNRCSCVIQPEDVTVTNAKAHKRCFKAFRNKNGHWKLRAVWVFFALLVSTLWFRYRPNGLRILQHQETKGDSSTSLSV